jgi:GNAT superfamily N-acetyltransferase
MTTVRAGTLDDAAAVLDLRRASFPWQVSTVPGLRHTWARMVDNAKGALFAVDDASGLAGFVRCGLNTWTSEQGAASLAVLVRADRRGRGIGTALLEAADDHLGGVGARRAQAYVLDEPASLRWARGRGYETKAEERYSGVHLADLPPAPAMATGVTVLTFDEVGPEKTFLVDSESSLDQPGEMTLDKIGYADWLHDIWTRPSVRRDLSVVALVDGEPAAYTAVEADVDTGRIWSGGTGTRRAFRGRGLAKIVKSVALRRAREAGLTAAYTATDELNAPMLAVNVWLGYRPVGAEWECVKRLSQG